MKKRIALTTVFLMMAALAQSAFAAGPKDFVEEFLRRYKPSPIRVPAMPGAENALADRIRDGVLPLTVSDLVDLVLRNNLDIGINRLTPFSTRNVFAKLSLRSCPVILGDQPLRSLPLNNWIQSFLLAPV